MAGWYRTSRLIRGMLLTTMVACADSAAPEKESTVEGDDLGIPAVDSRLAEFLPEGATLEMARQGRDLFPVCSVCHGQEARGTQLGPSLRDPEWIHISPQPDEIAELIRTGVPEPEAYPVPMPVMGGGEFSEDELRSLATYVYLLSREGE